MRVLTSIQEDGCDKGAHQSYLGTERKREMLLSFQTGITILNVFGKPQSFFFLFLADSSSQREKSHAEKR